MIVEIFRVFVFILILFLLGAAIFFFVKAQLRKAKKWRQLRRWAKVQDYELPKKAGLLMWLCIVIGLVAGVLPGLFLVLIAIRKNQNYEREMRSLMNKWIDAGKPLPAKE